MAQVLDMKPIKMNLNNEKQPLFPRLKSFNTSLTKTCACCAVIKALKCKCGTIMHIIVLLVHCDLAVC